MNHFSGHPQAIIFADSFLIQLSKCESSQCDSSHFESSQCDSSHCGSSVVCNEPFTEPHCSSLSGEKHISNLEIAKFTNFAKRAVYVLEWLALERLALQFLETALKWLIGLNRSLNGLDAGGIICHQRRSQIKRDPQETQFKMLEIFCSFKFPNKIESIEFRNIPTADDLWMTSELRSVNWSFTLWVHHWAKWPSNDRLSLAHQELGHLN